MSSVILDTRILNQASQLLKDQEYTTFELPDLRKKTPQVVYVLIEKTNSSVKSYIFNTSVGRKLCMKKLAREYYTFKTLDINAILGAIPIKQ